MPDITAIKTAKKILSILLLAFSAFGCNGQPKIPEKMHAWKLYISMPSLYPIDVKELYGINESADWTRPTHGYGLAINRSTLENVKRNIKGTDYDGLGIVLDTFVNMSAVQIGSGTPRPPESIYASWVSMYDKKLYITKIDLPKEVTQYMYKKQMYQPRFAGAADECYQTNFTLAFLPNGHVKVWLSGCGKYTYIKDQAPDAMFDKKTIGFDPDHYNIATEFLKKDAVELGVVSQPVPWDKVNRIYWDTKAFKVEDFADVKQ